MAADSPGEPGEVADPRARSRLATGDVVLDEESLEALGGCIDGGGEAGRPGADDRDVVCVGAELRRASRGLDQIGVRRIDEDAPVVPDSGRHAAAGHAGLVEEFDASGRVGGVELVRHREPRQEIPDLVGAPAVLGRDDAEEVEAGVGRRSRPARQSLADRGVEPVVGDPRLDEVVVDLPQRHGGDDRVGARVVAGDEQDTLGGGVQLVRSGEEVDARHLGHPVIRDQDGDGRRVGDERLELLERRRRAEGACDLRVGAEAAAEIALECVEHGGIRRDEKDDRLPFTAWCCCLTCPGAPHEAAACRRRAHEQRCLLDRWNRLVAA